MAPRYATERRAPEAATQTRTIVALGDSIVYGWGVPPEQSFPAVLERLLNRGASPRDHWRVINSGVPGDTALMGCVRYARDVTPFAPQVVIFCFGLNDAALRRTRFDAQRERLWQAQRCPWMRLRVVAEGFLARALCSRRARIKETNDEVWREPKPRVRPKLFVAALREMVRRARREGARAYLLPMRPAPDQRLSPLQQQWYAQYNELIRKVARREGAELVDERKLGLPPFSPETMLAEDGVHLTASGQEWLAMSLYLYLLAREHWGSEAIIGRDEHDRA